MHVEVFEIVRRIVRGLAGFVAPFCFQSENKKAVVVSFTSMRLVNELFVLLSGMSKDVVAGYFKRSLGSRKGHTAAVIVSDVRLCSNLQEEVWKTSHRIQLWRVEC